MTDRLDDAGVKLEKLSDGAVIQENAPGRFVWAQEDRVLVALADTV